MTYVKDAVVVCVHIDAGTQRALGYPIDMIPRGFP